MENKNQVRPYDDVVLDRKDIEAVASSRFFRRDGIKILLVWAFVTLIIAIFFNFTSVVPIFLSYILFALDAIFFVYWYAKKSTEIRVLLKSNMEKHMTEQRQKNSKES
jgi:uncharacterized protein YacL